MQKKSKSLNDDPSDFGWQRYYKIWFLAEVRKCGYAICYNEDSELPGELAYSIIYRTHELAERGARRLHRRLHGAMEDAIFGPKK